MRAAWVLGLLGRDAEMALPALQRGAKGEVAVVALACRWAATRITFRGTLLADYSANHVVLLDDKDQPKREIAGLSGPWYAEPGSCPAARTTGSAAAARRARH